MGTKYELGSLEVHRLCNQVMEKHHGDILHAGVTVAIVFADAGILKPAVKLHGRPCYATISNTAVRERALGIADALITIDKNRWESIDKKHHVPLLDHELTHLKVKRDKKGHIVVDDAGRPALEMRKHDWELSGFSNIVDRYGSAAVELLEFGKFGASDAGQSVFEFMDTSKKKAPCKKKAAPSNDDDLVDQAVEMIRETGRATTSAIQRRLKVGYNKAAKVMGLLEERGVIGPPVEKGPRAILELPEAA